MNILIISGSAGEGNQTQKVARYIETKAKDEGFSPTVLMVNEYITKNGIRVWDNTIQEEYKARVKEAEGYIIVSPEYNHSYPGELKILLDAANHEYAEKPVGIASVSSGGFGGVRMVEHLLSVVDVFRMVHIKPDIAFSRVQESFDENGNLKDSEKIDEKIETMLKEMQRYHKVLQQLQ